jgi:hypothetical protein
MTTAAFIRKWLANPEKHYDEHCRNEMLDDLYSVIEQAQTEQKLNIHGVSGKQPAYYLIRAAAVIHAEQYEVNNENFDMMKYSINDFIAGAQWALSQVACADTKGGQSG